MHIQNALEALRRRLQANRRQPTTASAEVAPDEAIAVRTEDLLERRLALDARRGPFGEYTYVYDELASLETRRASGELSNEEFEREKRRILEGPSGQV